MEIPVVMSNGKGAKKPIGVGHYDRETNEFKITFTDTKVIDFINKGLKDGPQELAIASIFGKANQDAHVYQPDAEWWEQLDGEWWNE